MSLACVACQPALEPKEKRKPFQLSNEQKMHKIQQNRTQ